MIDEGYPCIITYMRSRPEGMSVIKTDLREIRRIRLTRAGDIPVQLSYLLSAIPDISELQDIRSRYIREKMVSPSLTCIDVRKLYDRTQFRIDVPRLVPTETSWVGDVGFSDLLGLTKLRDSGMSLEQALSDIAFAVYRNAEERQKLLDPRKAVSQARHQESE